MYAYSHCIVLCLENKIISKFFRPKRSVLQLITCAHCTGSAWLRQHFCDLSSNYQYGGEVECSRVSLLNCKLCSRTRKTAVQKTRALLCYIILRQHFKSTLSSRDGFNAMSGSSCYYFFFFGNHTNYWSIYFIYFFLGSILLKTHLTRICNTPTTIRLRLVLLRSQILKTTITF